MTQMASIMIDRAQRQRVPWLDRPKLDKELTDITNLGRERLSLSRRGRTVQQMAVVLEEGATTRGVDEDRIDLVNTASHAGREHLAVGRRELPGRSLLGGMVVQGPAAALGARNPHVAAIVLQDTNRGHGGL